MTNQSPTDDLSIRSRCGWCRRVLVRRPGPGRPRKFCRQACRQWEWVSRQRAVELDLGSDEIVVRRSDVDALHDDLYVLSAALEDATRDLEETGATTDASELRRILASVIEAAQPVSGRSVITTHREASD